MIERDARINSPLYDRTGLNVLSEEVRLASNGNELHRLAGRRLLPARDRHYGQNLPTAGYDALIGAPSSSYQRARSDTPFYSDLSYRLKQYAGFGEATWHITSSGH